MSSRCKSSRSILTVSALLAVCRGLTSSALLAVRFVDNTVRAETMPAVMPVADGSTVLRVGPKIAAAGNPHSLQAPFRQPQVPIDWSTRKFGLSCSTELTWQAMIDCFTQENTDLLLCCSSLLCHRHTNSALHRQRPNLFRLQQHMPNMGQTRSSIQQVTRFRYQQQSCAIRTTQEDFLC